MGERLCVVMPVYNERDAIGPVLEKWSKALDALSIDYTIRPYNDGSKDDSLTVMKSVAGHLPHVEVRDKPNGGHGNTILTGYREAAEDGFDWVFQIDSDDEMGPEKFGELWAKRENHDFLIGIRDGRIQQLPRKVISFVSRLCVRLFYGKSVWDVNTPYRLMRVSAFKSFYQSIPMTTFAPNVILSGLAARHQLRCYEIRVPQHDRTTGEVSIKKWKLLKAAVRSFAQTVAFALASYDASRQISRIFIGAVIVVSAIKLAIAYAAGSTFDTESFSMVADGILNGQSPYVVGRYNYAPVWCYVVSLFRLAFGENLHWMIVIPVLLADVMIALLLYGRYRLAAWIYLLSPLVVLISGYYRMFDNVAIALALWGCLKFDRETEEDGFGKTIALAIVLGASLLVKHVFAFFPFWIALRERSIIRKMILFLIPLGMFGLSFVFPIVSEAMGCGKIPNLSVILSAMSVDGAPEFPVLTGIIKNVFLYKPMGHSGVSFFWQWIMPGCVAKAVVPGVGFLASVIILPFFVKECRLVKMLCVYLCALFVFSPGLWSYYWILPALGMVFAPFRYQMFFFAFSFLAICGRVACMEMPFLANHIPILTKVLMLAEFASVIIVLRVLIWYVKPDLCVMPKCIGNVGSR